uniref:Uncharacterized protein n=1 Tax=Anopheles atroparvus TaxID=41427 RepID=A0A182JCE9_ANOAO
MMEICESVRLFLTLFGLTLSKTARVDDSSSSRRSSSIVSFASSRSTSETLVFISSISFRISRSSCSMLHHRAPALRRFTLLPVGLPRTVDHLPRSESDRTYRAQRNACLCEGGRQPVAHYNNNNNNNSNNSLPFRRSLCNHLTKTPKQKKTGKRNPRPLPFRFHPNAAEMTVMIAVDGGAWGKSCGVRQHSQSDSLRSNQRAGNATGQ